MICKIGAAAAAGLTATLLLTGAAGANAFQTDQSAGGFTVVSKQDPEKCKEDSTGGKKKQGETSPSETSPSEPGAAGNEPAGSDPAPAQNTPEPAAGILPDTGSATGQKSKTTGDEGKEPVSPKTECKKGSSPSTGGGTGTTDGTGQAGTGTTDGTGTGTGTGTTPGAGTGTGTTPGAGESAPTPADTSRTTH
ncbi:hypothetical protein ACFYO1_04420 [Nocardia sp. NPDC006044]|uniref:hypothetical protein n=1 Tax=Nocardia sp. NPDC006044 TaxID=3364306 RepID=UPI0036B18990